MTPGRLAAAGLAVLLSSSVQASAQTLPNGAYFGITSGVSTFYDVDGTDFDLFGLLFAGKLGYHFTARSRLEIELQYETSGADDADDAEVIRGTTSYYYNFEDRTLIGIADVRPYAGGGAGFAKTDVDSIENNAFTAHVETGLLVPIDDKHLDFIGAIRFQYTPLDSGDGFDDDLLSSQLRAGLHYYF